METFSQRKSLAAVGDSRCLIIPAKWLAAIEFKDSDVFLLEFTSQGFTAKKVKDEV